MEGSPIPEKLASTEPHDQLVIVDAGDLEEAMQSAEAWASQLRERKDPNPAVADRIDQAVHRLRASSQASLTAKSNGGRVRLIYGPFERDGEESA